MPSWTKKVNINNWFLTYQSILAKRIKRYSWTALLATQYAAMKGLGDLEGTQIKPDIIVAGVPVWNINKIGHAVSDEILKYRSMGGIFLAHQKGGKQTFHFTAKIFGPMRFVTYKLLEALQLLGTEESKSVQGLPDIANQPGMNDIKLDFKDPKKGIMDVQGQIEAGSLGSPFYEFIEDSEFANAEYAFHRTFPIITDTKIYTDMYLETLVCREDVKFGKNVLEIECAFRHFEAPMFYQKTVPNVEGKRNFYTVFIPRRAKTWLKRIEGIINLGWAALQTQFYLKGEGRAEAMFEKEKGKNDWEGTVLVSTLIAHLFLSSVSWPKSMSGGS